MLNRYSHNSTDKDKSNHQDEIFPEFLSLCDGDPLSALLLYVIHQASNQGSTPVLLTRQDFLKALDYPCSDTTVKRKLKSLFQKVLIKTAPVVGSGVFYSTTGRVSSSDPTPIQHSKTDCHSTYSANDPTPEWHMWKMTRPPQKGQKYMPFGCVENDPTPSEKLDIVNNIYNRNIEYSSSITDKLLPIKANEAVESTRSIEVAFLKSETEETDSLMGLEQVKSVLRVYHLGGNKFKADMYKKSVANLAARFGEKLQGVINTYGEEQTIEGIRKFLDDQFWQDNGLPLPAFLKSPDRWISENGSETRYNAPQKKSRVTGLSRIPASPGPSNEQESVFLAPKPMDRLRLRAMRRNEGMVLLNSCGSDLLPKYREETAGEISDLDLDKWFLRACEEFKRLRGIEAPVSTKPVYVKGEVV